MKAIKAIRLILLMTLIAMISPFNFLSAEAAEEEIPEAIKDYLKVGETIKEKITYKEGAREIATLYYISDEDYIIYDEQNKRVLDYRNCYRGPEAKRNFNLARLIISAKVAEESFWPPIYSKEWLASEAEKWKDNVETWGDLAKKSWDLATIVVPAILLGKAIVQIAIAVPAAYLTGGLSACVFPLVLIDIDIALNAWGAMSQLDPENWPWVFFTLSCLSGKEDGTSFVDEPEVKKHISEEDREKANKIFNWYKYAYQNYQIAHNAIIVAYYACLKNPQAFKNALPYVDKVAWALITKFGYSQEGINTYKTLYGASRPVSFAQAFKGNYALWKSQIVKKAGFGLGVIAVSYLVDQPFTAAMKTIPVHVANNALHTTMFKALSENIYRIFDKLSKGEILPIEDTVGAVQFYKWLFFKNIEEWSRAWANAENPCVLPIPVFGCPEWLSLYPEEEFENNKKEAEEMYPKAEEAANKQLEELLVYYGELADEISRYFENMSRRKISVNVMPTYYSWPGREITIWGNVHWGDSETGTYVWDFGDGTEPVSGEVKDPHYIAVKHTYTTMGPKIATLTVTTKDGVSDSDKVRINVLPETPETKRLAAIEDGLRWLYLDQNADGSWDYKGGHKVGGTGAAILAFELQGHLPTNDIEKDIYAEYVCKGLDFIFAHAYRQELDEQKHGDPDTDGDEIGIYFKSGGRGMYESAIAMMAIIASGSPNLIASTGPKGVKGQTYKEIIRDAVDYYAWAQNEADKGRGGWRYSPNSDESDNSVSQWPAIALEAAETQWGIKAPNFVKEELLIWLEYSQNKNGGFGYKSPDEWVNVAKTGAGICELAYCNVPATDPRVIKALDFLNKNWERTGPGGAWKNDNFGDYYAMYAVAKGCRISNPPIILIGDHDWWKEYTSYLLKNQRADGSWPPAGYSDETLSTAWAIEVLSPGVTELPPVALIQAPSTVPPNSPVKFDGSKSFHMDPNKRIVRWEWDFNKEDGVDWSRPDAIGKIVINKVGYILPEGVLSKTIYVTLRVLDNSKPAMTYTTEYAITVNRENHPPIADAGGPYSAKVGEEIIFDGRGSYDPDEGDRIVKYEWDLDGDGNYDDATGPTAVHIWYKEYSGWVGLKVTDSYGLTNEMKAYTTVWTSKKDLAISSADLAVSNPYPSQGETVTITAKVHYSSESTEPVDNVKVRFYDGNPDVAAVQIGEDQVIAHLEPGESGILYVNWVVPDTKPHDLYVRVDPDAAIEEWDEENNEAFITLGKPSKIIYVATTGSDTKGDGSKANPYQTINKGLEAAENGYTIQIAAGTYNENIKVNKQVTIIGEDPETTIIQGDGTSSVIALTADGCRIEGLKVTGSSAYFGSGGIEIRSSSNTIRNCIITENNSEGIYVAQNALSNTITHNTISFSHNSSGLRLYSNNNVVSHNTFISNEEFGIFAFSAANNTIIGNRLSDNNQGGIYINQGSSCIVSRNYITGGSFGISLREASQNIIGSNEIKSCSHDGISLVFSSNNRITGNLASGNWNGIYAHGSANNKIIGNFLSNNRNGFYLEGSSNDNVLHQNIIVGNQVSVIDKFDNSGNRWNSPEQISYTYKGVAYQNYLGNFWSDYKGQDADGDGIGDSPYSIPGGGQRFDNYPLIEPWPVISFTYSPEKPVALGTVTFNASASYDPNGEIVSYDWDFGDGSSGSGMIVRHTYAEAGNYTVTLTIRDSDEIPNMLGKDIMVTAAGTIEGRVILQGRSNHSGVRITAGDFQTFSDSEGLYSFDIPAGTYSVRLSLTGYLEAEKDEVVVRENQTTVLPAVTLLGGDADHDGDVDSADLALIAFHFNTTNSASDINGSGLVDIHDLVLAGRNFGQRKSPWPNG